MQLPQPMANIDADQESPFFAPLSFAQQRLWFLSQLYPETAVYNVPFGLRLIGELDQPALIQALEKLAERHGTLRTRFQEVNEQAQQVIRPHPSVEWTEKDLTRTPNQDNEVAALREREASQPFNLETGPLWRVTLVKLKANEHLLLITLHHIICDGWSAKVLVRDLLALYEQAVTGKEAPLPDLAIQYADYAAWQQEYFIGGNLREPLEWWKGQLAGAPALLDLPTEFPRPNHQTFPGRTESLPLRGEILQRIQEFCRAQNATPFMFHTACLAILLHRYTRQADILLGTPVANRGRTELEPLIGFVANTAVLRTRLEGNPEFTDLLQQVRNTTLDAFAHTDLPFDKLVEELHPQRNLAHNPIFQVMIGAFERQGEAGAAAGLRFEVLDPNVTTSKFDLSLYIVEGKEETDLLAEYNTDLFSREFIQRFLGHLQSIYSHVLAHPSTRIAAIPILSAAECELMKEWNNTARDLGQETTLVQLLEKAAEKHGTKPALTFEGATLTYAEMNRRANQIAHELRARGAARDTLVGVAMERSFEMVLALIAIMKAGAAYVPIDPAYPQERIDFMLADAGMSILLTQEKLRSRLGGFGGELICLEGFAQNGKAENPAPLNTPDDLAYCIYTSGSTGKPKGALNTHRGICNRLLWGQAAYPITDRDKVLQKTPFSFDVSVWEFFWPLTCGATLVIAKPEGHKDPAYLAELIEREQVTTVHFVPSMLQAFLNESSVSRCKSIRKVICSGEALTRELQQRFFDIFECQLLNYYGPTEAAVEVTFWECARNSPLGFVPIGNPIANTQMHVLNEGMQPQPVLAPGELHIGGIGVARGYHNRPQLTEERFVPDPFSKSPGARLYKTGDLARRLPDGSIQYLGRIDFQVKIRGFRIELGEIEAALGRHPLVREAVVVAREVKGEQQLVAYCVPYPAVQLDKEKIRSHLKSSLPEYMVPAHFVELRAIPLNSNGKVDRKALPEPSASAAPGAAYTAPRNETEQKLARIWCDVLRLEKAGVHDNFFELGGHSLLATQLVSRIRSTFQTQLPLSRFFERPTIAQIGEELGRGGGVERALDRTGTINVSQLSESEVERLLREHLAQK